MSLLWRQLNNFNYFRATLATVIIAVFLNATGTGFLGTYKPEAFFITSLAFLLSSLIYIYCGINRKFSFYNQVVFSNAADIFLIILMAHFSGGLGSGLAMLLIINIIATSSFLQSRESFLFAAIASMAVLTEQTHSFLSNVSTIEGYSKAGILGIVFFVSTTLASILSRRVLESEALASQRTADLINLEKLNEHIIQNMRTGILVVSEDGRVRTHNSAAKELMGYKSLEPRPLLKDISPELFQRYIDWRSQPHMLQQPITHQHGMPDIQPGFRKLHESSSTPGDTLIFLEDATRLNQRFQQIKLASLGKLTASIAHEIRNPLSAINHASQLLNESDSDPVNKKLTGIITSQVQRLDAIIQNVLQLSRNEPGSQKAINLHEWLTNFIIEFCMSNDFNESQVEIQPTTEKTLVLFDSEHLYQVVNNLCSNSINHSNKPRDQINIKLIIGYDQEQDQPYLDIVDNGPGIDSNLIEQIFDPFFTTSSKGTGLGLYISKEIVESNRGKIRYLDEFSGGSCFRLGFLTGHE